MLSRWHDRIAVSKRIGRPWILASDHLSPTQVGCHPPRSKNPSTWSKFSFGRGQPIIQGSRLYGTGNIQVGEVSFWEDFRRCGQPFFVLAPLANVTDASFRFIIAKYGKPAVIFTEFVSTAGLVREEGRKRLLIDLQYHEIERPIVAQLFGSDPYQMYDCIHFIHDLGFDGIDINMGCPDRIIVKQGAGSGLIERPQLAQEILASAKRAIQDIDMRNSEKSASMPRRRRLGLSIKTRIGGTRECLGNWLPYLLEVEPDALTLHLRTRAEQSLVEAHWTAQVVGKAVKIVKEQFGGKTLLIGNGDVADLTDARAKAFQWGLDGIMLGRAIFGNPWLFREDYQATTQEKLLVLVEHAKLYDQMLTQHKPLAYMKKHYKAYVTGFQESKYYRMKLMEANSVEEIESIVHEAIGQINHDKLLLDSVQYPSLTSPSLMHVTTNNIN